MELEVTLQDGPHGLPPSYAPSGIGDRRDRAAHEGVALWEITLTLMIRGPESWWKQAGPYFREIVWLRSRPEQGDDQRQLTQDDFEDELPSSFLEHLNTLISGGNRSSLKTMLPDSFIRTGIVQTNMETLATILKERGHYDAGHWKDFCSRLREMEETGRILNDIRP
jgi:hypothetical protein